MTYQNESEVQACLEKTIERVRADPVLSSVLDRMAASGELYPHSIQVAKLSAQLAISTGMDASETDDLCVAGLLHDAGKLLTPDAVLYKPGPLSPDELAVIRKHPQDGYDMCATLPDRPRGIIRDHHEKNGGTGYPRGLKIVSPYCSIVTVADIFSALSEPRSYHKAQTALEAMTSVVMFDGLDRDLITLLPTIVM